MRSADRLRLSEDLSVVAAYRELVDPRTVLLGAGRVDAAEEETMHAERRDKSKESLIGK